MGAMELWSYGVMELWGQSKVTVRVRPGKREDTTNLKSFCLAIDFVDVLKMKSDQHLNRAVGMW